MDLPALHAGLSRLALLASRCWHGTDNRTDGEMGVDGPSKLRLNSNWTTALYKSFTYLLKTRQPAGYVNFSPWTTDG